MADQNTDPFRASDDLFMEARAFALSIVAIRHAQGKLNPADFEIGTSEWKTIVQDFAADILRLSAGTLKQFAPLTRIRPSE